jgi:hypothetical protein
METHEKDHNNYDYLTDAEWAQSIMNLHRDDVNIARKPFWEYIPVGGVGGLIGQTLPSMNAYRTLIKCLTADQEQWTLLTGT